MAQKCLTNSFTGRGSSGDSELSPSATTQSVWRDYSQRAVKFCGGGSQVQESSFLRWVIREKYLSALVSRQSSLLLAQALQIDVILQRSPGTRGRGHSSSLTDWLASCAPSNFCLFEYGATKTFCSRGKNEWGGVSIPAHLLSLLHCARASHAVAWAEWCTPPTVTQQSSLVVIQTGSESQARCANNRLNQQLSKPRDGARWLVLFPQ